MNQKTKRSIFAQFVLLIGILIGLSYIMNQVWVQKVETIPEKQVLIIEKSMTVTEFGQKNNLTSHILQNALDLKSQQDLNKKLVELDLSDEELTTRIDKASAIEAEHGSKDWVKILIKFGVWIIFLGISFNLLRKGKINPKVRKILYLTATIIFGVILGADPSAMGTVKDAIGLFAEKQVFFPPRMIALTVFLLLVFLANKFFCSWGCQIGVLQDLIFRLNRNKKDRKGILRQVKLPFVLTNTIRVAFFVIFTVISFAWAMDIIEFIDPFKIYKPEKIEIIGWVFLGFLLVLSLFVYRPWCTMFCPFGLVGWMVEKQSIFKIKVNYDTCEACQSCAKACPTTVMDTILKQDKVIPDCFSCGTCLEVCPTGSLSFSSGKRSKPPLGKFENNTISE
ncbi:4Fe-4S binding protein [bacterium]|nr:4Fe-4S binding protein [bacterium]